MSEKVESEFIEFGKKALEDGLTEDEALRILVQERLSRRDKDGYYRWVSLGEGTEAAWLYRIPRNDLPEEAWLKDEKSDFVHLCKSLDFFKAAVNKDKEAASKASAYIRDSDNNLNKIEQFHCTKCGKKSSEDVAKKAKMYINLHKLSKVR